MSLATVLAFAANNLAKNTTLTTHPVKDDKKPEKESEQSKQNG